MVTVPIMRKRDPIDVAVIRGAGGTPLGQLGVLPFRGNDLSMITATFGGMSASIDVTVQ